MKKRIRLRNWWKTWMGALILLAAMTVGFNMNSIVSLADSAGKITASSAKIRKEPSTTSETVGSAVQNAAVSVTGQITGSDGYTWYKVVVDGATTGYIRSDLMEITDGSTPAAVVPPTSNTTSTPTTSTPDEEVVDVADVEPVSGSVKGNSPVRVRQNASTTSRIVTNAEGGMALTVVGQATGSDGKEWYLVQFIAGGSEVSGFIRADYVNLSGDLVPAGSAQQEPVEQEPEKTDEPEEPAKAWDTVYTEEDSKWHLIDNTTGNSYDIAQIFDSVETNNKSLQDMLKENKTQQIIIIIMVILVIVLATVVSLLLFKLKDLGDMAYYNEVEQETIRRRTADRPVTKSQNGSGTQNGQRRQTGQRPQAGQRPQTSQRPQTGQRPVSAQGARPQRAGSQGARPQGAGAQGARPQGAGAQGARPQGAGPQGVRPQAGQRPAGAPSGQPQAGARPQTGRQPQTDQRPAAQQSQTAGTQGARPAGTAQAPVRQQQMTAPEPKEEMIQNIFTDDTVVYDRAEIQQAAEQIEQQNTGWQAKNFTNEDELEFHFLNLEDHNKN